MGCGFDDSGGPDLTWSHLAGWCELIGPPLVPWEANALMMIARTAKIVAANAAAERMRVKK
jgi:hypothetical protein